jgi:hypothetical protein
MGGSKARDGRMEAMLACLGWWEFSSDGAGGTADVKNRGKSFCRKEAGAARFRSGNHLRPTVSRTRDAGNRPRPRAPLLLPCATKPPVGRRWVVTPRSVGGWVARAGDVSRGRV